MPRASLSAVAVILVCASTTRGDEPQAYRVRGVAGLPASTRIELARLGEPSWHDVEKEGVTLRAALRDACGSQGASVNAVLESLALRLNGGHSLDRVVMPGTAVALPFCVKIDERVSVEVSQGDTLEGLLRRHYGVFGPTTQEQALKLNKEYKRWSSPDEFSRHLQPGSAVVLPYTSVERVFVPRHEAPWGSSDEHGPVSSAFATLPDVLATLQGEAFAEMTRSAFASAGPEPPKDRHEFEYVRFVSGGAATDSACSAEGAPPFDAQQLRVRLSAERAGLPGGAHRAVVGIIDTGIGGLGGPFFALKYFRANPAELGGKDDRDDDVPENYFVDDVYGINLNGGRANGAVQPYSADPDAPHGTKVASVILGGPSWLDGVDPIADPLVQLKIVNFSDSTRPGPVHAVHLATAIHYLDAQQADVVNMSLANGVPLEGVMQAIQSKGSRVLFAVAAGNDGHGGRNLAVTKVFPARYGGRIGDFRRTVVTVGAHDRAGVWASFSNYSSDYVDLLAPGCAVPTMAPDGSTAPEHGTSIATAFVSFAAGLLSSLGENNAQNIKNRLLFSADVDDALNDRAWASGRLNIVKAISLRHDVIEVTNKAAPYYYGRLTDPDELRRFCGDEAQRQELDGIRKVRPNLVRSGKTWTEYWVENDGILSKVTCPQILSDESIGTIVKDGKEGVGPILSDTSDIVLATK